MLVMIHVDSISGRASYSSNLESESRADLDSILTSSNPHAFAAANSYPRSRCSPAKNLPSAILNADISGSVSYSLTATISQHFAIRRIGHAADAAGIVTINNA